MIQFWSIAAAMLILALLCVIPPLLRQPTQNSDERDKRTNNALAVAIYRTGLIEIERELTAGHLSIERHAEARNELERRLVDETNQVAAPAARPASIALRSGTAAVLLALLPSIALVLYMQLGDPLAVALQTDSDTAQMKKHTDMQGSVDEMVGRLAAKLQQQPDDVQGWKMLARSYAVLNRTEDAVAAYRRALALAPADSQLLTDYADTLATANGGDLNGAPLQSIQAALAIDPDNPKALALAGSAAFANNAYPLAIQYWERLKQVSSADSEIAIQTQKNIDEARKLNSTGVAADAQGSAQQDGP